MAISVGRPRGGAISEINVTPMADVMIVLLIIFMVMTPFVVQPPVQLPSALHTREHARDRVEIVVRATGTITAGDEALPSAEALADHLLLRAARGAPLLVLVQADRSVGYAEVARVLAACRRAGVQEVALAAQSRPGS